MRTGRLFEIAAHNVVGRYLCLGSEIFEDGKVKPRVVQSIYRWLIEREPDNNISDIHTETAMSNGCTLNLIRIRDGGVTYTLMLTSRDAGREHVVIDHQRGVWVQPFGLAGRFRLDPEEHDLPHYDDSFSDSFLNTVTSFNDRLSVALEIDPEITGVGDLNNPDMFRIARVASVLDSYAGILYPREPT